MHMPEGGLLTHACDGTKMASKSLRLAGLPSGLLGCSTTSSPLEHGQAPVRWTTWSCASIWNVIAVQEFGGSSKAPRA